MNSLATNYECHLCHPSRINRPNYASRSCSGACFVCSPAFGSASTIAVSSSSYFVAFFKFYFSNFFTKILIKHWTSPSVGKRDMASTLAVEEIQKLFFWKWWVFHHFWWRVAPPLQWLGNLIQNQRFTQKWSVFWIPDVVCFSPPFRMFPAVPYSEQLQNGHIRWPGIDSESNKEHREAYKQTKKEENLSMQWVKMLRKTRT